MSAPGSPNNPLCVAIIGSGPSGFYATEALLRSELAVRVDILDRLPTPFGLVRGGVSPDHPKLKQVSKVYDKTAQSPDVSFLGNVMVGRDVSVEELKAAYHAIIFSCGAETDRHLGIPGEDLKGSHTATEFVGWYNGHPDYRDRQFDLSQPAAAVIGQGNVALDVCRILSKTADELKHTDIAEHALDALAESAIREVHVIGRRGPAQAKFTYKELAELGELADCDPVVAAADLELNAASEAELAEKGSRNIVRNVELFRGFSEIKGGTKSRRCIFHFLESPEEILGQDHVEAIKLAKNALEGEASRQAARPTGETEILDCGLVFRSIGYRGIAIPGVPFDDRRGIFPNQDGRLLNGENTVPGIYVAGWIKRGPSGIIGTNKPDAFATVDALLADLARLDTSTKPGGAAILAMLADRGVRGVSYPDWQNIDSAEISRGEPKSKPREKFTRVPEMLAVLD
ncbi:MAG: FAD-dependent oxidoreductase [Alphaproteobacteria bacterium]